MTTSLTTRGLLLRLAGLGVALLAVQLLPARDARSFSVSGAAKNALLAINISQALYTTAAGLVIAVPAIGFYFLFRNRAAKLILTMEGLTMDVMKGVRRGESNV